MQTATTAPQPLNDEAEAVRVALEGSWLARMRVALRAGRRLHQNPDDTRQVFLLGAALNAGRLPRLVERFVADDEGSALLRDDACIDSHAVDYVRLRTLAPDTLGGAYARFLDGNGLDPDLFQAPPGMPPVSAYLAKRLRQSHDIWHVVTGLGPDIPGEIALQAFTYAQTAAPSALLIALLGTLRYAWRRRGLLASVLRAYRLGKRATFLPTVRWERWWERPLADVRRDLGLG
jgi:ubiquinone biosynthesis protein COQ4